MKNVSKRLLSLLLAICLLASIALPAGVMPVMAETEVDPSTTQVTEYLYQTSGSDQTVLNASAYTVTSDTQVEISFNYYIPAAPSNLYVYDTNGNATIADGSDAKLAATAGIGLYEAIFDVVKSGSSIFRLHAAAKDFGGVVYIWNLSITSGGSDLSVSSTAGKADFVVAGDMLADYNWYYDEPDPKKTTVTEYTFVNTSSPQTILTLNSYNYVSNVPIVISFDYYLPNAASNLYIYDTNNKAVIAEGSEKKLTGSGISHYESAFISTSSSSATFRLHAATKDFGGTVYIWNFSIKQNGVDLTPSDRSYWPTKTGYADLVTEGDKLFDYSWYPNKDTTVHRIQLSKFDESALSSALTGATYYGVFAYGDTYSLLKPAEGTDAVLSFDYYLPEGADIVVKTDYGNKPVLTNDLTGSQVLEPGYGSFKCTINQSETGTSWRWTLYIAKSTSAPKANVTVPDIYLWNVNTQSTSNTKTMPPATSYHSKSTLATQIAAANGSVTAADVIEEITLADVYYDYPDLKNEDPTVTKFDFTGCTQDTIGSSSYKEYYAYLYSGFTAPTTGDYTVSFEYYLEGGGTSIFTQPNGSTKANTYPGAEPLAPNTYWLRAGRYKYEATLSLTAGNSTYIRFQQRSNQTLCKLYVWNVSIKLKDVEKTTNLVSGNYYAVDTNATDRPLATATPGLKLSDFTWSDANTVTPANKINLSLFDTSGLSSSAYLTQGGTTSFGIFGYSDTYQLLKSNESTTKAVLSFDYYLPEGADVVVWSSHPSSTILTNELTDSQVLEPGYGSFKVTRANTETSSWRWFFTVVKNPNAPAPAKLPDIYIWNLNVVKIASDSATASTTYTTPTTTSIYSKCKLAAAGYTKDQAMEVGMLSDFMDEINAYEKNQNVAELDFSACAAMPDSETANKVSMYTGWYGLTEASTYTLDFDYYLPATDTHTVVMQNSVVYENEDEDAAYAPGTGWLRPGRNHYTASGISLSTSSKGSTVDFVQYGDAARSELLVWNVSLVREGDGANPTNLTSGAYWGPVATNSAVAVTPMLKTALPTELPEEPDDSTETVVSKINLNKFDTANFDANSYLTTTAYGVFSYSNAYSKLYATAAAPEATLSFDYFLPGDIGLSVYSFNATGGRIGFLANELTKSSVLERGRHSFSATVTREEAWHWGLVLVKNNSATAPTDIPEIYIWNLKLEYNGVTVDSLAADNELATMRANCALAASITDDTAGLEFTTLTAIEDEIEEYEETTYVTEIDFSKCDTKDSDSTGYMVYLYTGWAGHAAGSYTLTFDYYLPADSTYSNDTSTGNMTVVYNKSGSVSNKYLADSYTWLLEGYNKFKGTFDVTAGSQYITFRQRANKPMTKLYIWNVSLVPTDEASTDKTDLLSGGYWEKDATQAESGNNALVTEDNVLANYDWYKTAVTNGPEDETTVYHLDGEGLKTLATGAKTILSSSGFKATKNTTSDWVLSFEYYLTEDAPIWVYDGSSSYYDDTTGSRLLQQGRHKFTCTFKHDATRSPAFWYLANANIPASAQLYLWNIRLSTAEGDAFRTFNPTGGSLLSGVTSSVGRPSAVVGADNYGDGGYVERTAVTEIDFSELEKSNEGTVYGVATVTPYYSSIGHASDRLDYSYELSFDYYLPASNTSTYVWFDDAYTSQYGDTLIYNEAEGEKHTYQLQQGRHHFTATIKELNEVCNSLILRQVLDVDGYFQPSKVYIWNLSVKPITQISTGSPVKESDNQFLGCHWTTANANVTVTPTVLTDDLMTEKEDVNTVGASYRDDYSLRFVSTIECEGVERMDHHMANYGAATIYIDGIPYVMTGAGTLFARDVMLGGVPEDILTLDNLGDDAYKKIIRNVPANKLLTDEYLQYLNTSNGTNVSGIAFSCVIKNIPRGNWDETLSARSYVTYEANGEEHVLYGDVVSRSIVQTQPLYTEQSSPLDAEADKKREDIVGAANTEYNLDDYETVIYVSSNGDATMAEGSYENPYTSLEQLNDAMEVVDTTGKTLVLFERGSLFRGCVYMYENTTYSAYGTGEKPRFYGSLENYADNEWSEHDTIDNVWVLDTQDNDDFTCIDTQTYWGNDIGNIFFINETTDAITGKITDTVVEWGEKMYYDPEKGTSAPNLLENFQFYHDQSENRLYLYYDGGNPGTIADRIEMGGRFCVFKRAETGMDNIIVDNVCIRYTGGHGIGFGANDNVTVTNCEIGWIGGSMHSAPAADGSGGRTRFGNGIEIYGDSTGDYVANNWIYQCFDAGYTNQSGTQSNITVENNLIEYCCYSIEIWDDSDEGVSMTDCTYTGNHLRFAGYNFERDNRMGSGLTVSSHINAFYSEKEMYNVLVTGNTLDTAYCHLVAAAYPGVDGKGPLFASNTYIQGYDRRSTVLFRWDINNDDPEVEGSVPQTWYDANNQAEMEASVAQLGDETPAEIIYSGKASYKSSVVE